MLLPVSAGIFFTLTGEISAWLRNPVSSKGTTEEVKYLSRSCALPHSLPKKSSLVKISLMPALVCSSLPPVFISVISQTFKRRPPYPSPSRGSRHGGAVGWDPPGKDELVWGKNDSKWDPGVCFSIGRVLYPYCIIWPHFPSPPPPFCC